MTNIYINFILKYYKITYIYINFILKYYKMT